MAVHAGLREENEQWSEARPASFDPYFLGSDVVEIGAAFPDIRFSSPWHGKDLIGSNGMLARLTYDD